MKPYTYDGNKNGNYDLFHKGNKLAELICGEDTAIEITLMLNEWVRL